MDLLSLEGHLKFLWAFLSNYMMCISINTTVLSQVIIYRLLQYVEHVVATLIHLVVLVSKVHDIYIHISRQPRANTCLGWQVLDTITNLPLQHSNISLLFSLPHRLCFEGEFLHHWSTHPCTGYQPWLAPSSINLPFCRKLGAKVAALLTATDYGPPSFSVVGTSSTSFLAVVIVVSWWIDR